MKEEDFPNYFQASDKVSIASQNWYLIIVRTDLISMIVAASLAVYNYQLVERKLALYIFTGIALFVGVVATIILLTKKFEDFWYQGRALAESCKTLTWRFITGAEYFEINLSNDEVRSKFIERIKLLVNEFPELSKEMNSKILNKPIITDKMLEVRNLSREERKEYYINKRIIDQKNWYAKKAEWNKLRYNFWFGFIIAMQFLAIISTVYLIKKPGSDWNFIGLFTTLAVSAISWLQIKRHQELKQAYTTATEELNFIHELSYSISNEDELAEFILDSENAISREHTVWLAQRRK